MTVENRYLSGNYAPVRDELTTTDLPVQGAIPPELRGRLLRNGPNPINVEDPATYHWFTGDGMVHGIELRDGKAVSYRNRWVRTDQAATALGEPTIGNQPAEVNFLQSVANTHVVEHAGRILALVESSLPTQLTPELETIGRFDFGGALRSPMTAHPKVDPVTGEMVFFGYDIFGPPYVRYHVVDRNGQLVKTEDITFGGPVMVHDFSITEQHVVWMDLPVVFDMEMAMAGRFPFAWKPDYGARLGVMPRAGGDADVRWFDIEPCYVFHPLNAYDDADKVVVDVSRHPDMFKAEQNGPAASSAPTLDRWTIDLNAGKVIEERLDDRGQEFPRVDDRVVGRRHRYGYATGAGVDNGIQFDGLLKHDLVAGTTEVHAFGSGGRAAGEGVFVPASDTAGEDEGWVLSVVYDAGRDRSDLVILDATDFTGSPVATVELPQRVPFGFHGSWVPDRD
jgi:carotenoid cleavage dioxygenase